MDENQPLKMLRVIVDDVRWQLIRALGAGDYRVMELVKKTGQPQNLISYHLKKLRDLHLVNERRSSADGRDVYYSLDMEQLRVLYEAAGQALHPALVSSPPKPLNRTNPFRVLFLCTGNSARSQMAEGLLRVMGNGAIEVSSAGTEPVGIHPTTISIMTERQIDITGQRSKSVDEVTGQSFDYVITVCDRAREQCPTFPGKAQFIHWSLPDPKLISDPDAQYQAFQDTADQLTVRIRYFLAQIYAQQEDAA